MGKPALRTRATIQPEKLAKFGSWAVQRGYRLELPKGGEVLRLRMEPRPPLLYYQREGDVVRCIGAAAALVHEWEAERARRREQQEVQA